MNGKRWLLMLSVFLAPFVFTAVVILLAHVGGCVYSGAYVCQPTFDQSKESSVRHRYPPATFDAKENAWRWSFTCRISKWRRGVYKYPPKFTPGGAHWGAFGAILEGACQLLIHTPTLPAERIMSATDVTICDYLLFDRNSSRKKVSLLDIPGVPLLIGGDCPAFSLESPEFQDYRTNSVMGLDYARWEELDQKYHQGEALTHDEAVELCRLRDSIDDWRPVLWWRNGEGIENLIIFRSVYEGGRYSELGHISHGNAQAYQLYYFKDAQFVRVYDFERRPEGMAADDTSFNNITRGNFLFDTIDGRQVNIACKPISGNFVCVDWMFRQIDLETGADRKVGSFRALAEGSMDDGLELRIVRTDKSYNR